MPFEIVRADITKLDVDAIVNAANVTLLGGGGVDGAIHKAAGPKLLEECQSLGGCKTGEAKITGGYNLTAKYVIHTVGPIWDGGDKGEEELLESCYRNALDLAVEHRLSSVALHLISSGVFGYPKDKALQAAISVISEYLMHHELLIILVVYDKNAFMLSEKLFSSVKSFIDDNYVDENVLSNRTTIFKHDIDIESLSVDEIINDYQVREKSFIDSPKAKRSLADLMDELQETFSEHLMRLIDLKGKTDVETYKRANIDRKLFSKIRSDKHYKPSKSTVIAFSIALELSLDETKDLLQKAGFALSHSSEFDLIIEYFITEENYNIYEINEALFKFDQMLLGV
jgi:O-acetyl-ADP-ribose deacetylase (regulator of RNase III)